MAHARFYVPPEDISGDKAVIKGDQARHIVSVLRKKPGDDIVLFDGRGTEYTAKILRVSRDCVVATVAAKEVHDSAERPAIGLYVALPKGKRFDLVVEKATELGADSITPLVTVRSVVRLDDRTISAKLDRWQRIAVAASKQCRRSTLPRINRPVDFSEASKELPESVFAMVAQSSGDACPIYDVLQEMRPSHREIRIYIGPEGDFTPEEMEMAKKAGMRFVSLGENILRTETAAVASLAAIACFLDRRSRTPARTLSRED